MTKAPRPGYTCMWIVIACLLTNGFLLFLWDKENRINAAIIDSQRREINLANTLSQAQIEYALDAPAEERLRQFHEEDEKHLATLVQRIEEYQNPKLPAIEAIKVLDEIVREINRRANELIERKKHIN